MWAIKKSLIALLTTSSVSTATTIPTMSNLKYQDPYYQSDDEILLKKMIHNNIDRDSIWTIEINRFLEGIKYLFLYDTTLHANYPFADIGRSFFQGGLRSPRNGFILECTIRNIDTNRIFANISDYNITNPACCFNEILSDDFVENLKNLTFEDVNTILKIIKEKM